MKSGLKRQRTLEPIDKYEKVNEFLNDISRGSIQTKKVYTFALSHMETFLANSEYKDYNLETILRELIGRDIDVYDLLNKFVGYLIARDTKLSFGSISLYVAGVRSYLESKSEIEISSKKFKARVKLPKKLTRDDEGIDAEDIRTILLSCTNATLRVFLLLLSCTGLRANEALSLRNSDLDFNESPTKVHIRAQTTKTGQARYIWISDECTKELKKFISSKSPNDLIFSKEGEAQTISIYKMLRQHFTKILDKVEMNKRKEGQGVQRRQVSFHSVRRFVYSTMSDYDPSFAEWYLGHTHSTYWRKKESVKREKYIKCMRALTFLDFSGLVTSTKNIELKLDQKDMQIEQLNKRLELIEAEANYVSDTLEKFTGIGVSRDWGQEPKKESSNKKKSKTKKTVDMVLNEKEKMKKV